MWSLEMIEISICFNLLPLRNIEAVAERCSVKKMFLEIWQNWQENTYARVSFLIRSNNIDNDVDNADTGKYFSC